MPRFFVGNFDFEHRLADPVRQLPARLDRINAELATSWLAIGDDGDFLWTPQPIDPAFFEQAAFDGLPRVRPVTRFQDVPAGTECIPWGWTNDVRRLCDQHGWIRNDPPDAAVRAANSRRLSSTLEHEWRVGLSFSGEATSIKDVERLIGWQPENSRWLIKAEFGMSGRERILGNGPLNEIQRNWIEKRLTNNGVVFFEPWVARAEEVGIQIEVPRTGDPQLIAIVPMLTHKHGEYAGSIFATPELSRPTATFDRDCFSSTTVEIALRAARRIQELGYFGPLGIDCMKYHATGLPVSVRPLQDINARWTMGRLSVGWKRLLKKYDHAGRWYHADLSSQGLVASSVLPALNQFRLFLGGMRLTAADEEVATFILSLPDEFNLLQLEAAFENGFSIGELDRDSVSRTLNLLVDCGLVYPVVKNYRTVLKHRLIQTSPEIVGGAPCTHKSFVVIS
jgi:hypothetical protein